MDKIKDSTQKVIQNLKKNPRASAGVILALMLPLLLGSVYVVQQLRPRATESCPPTNVRTERVSASTGRVIFNTSCAVQAQIYCSIGRTGIEFFCGEDVSASSTHVIETTDVTLNTNTGYYVFIDTELEQRTPAYIPASPDDITFGLDPLQFTTDALGVTADEPNFDPALDLNNDGVVNIFDRAYFYEE